MDGDAVGAPVRAVLIVEDAEPAAAPLEIAFLAIPNLEVRTARSGQEALRLLNGPRNGICALVTDLHMPVVDGFELIERVRADRRYLHMPIIVVSGDSDPKTPERIYQLGADAWFGKPYSPAQVRHKLEQLIDANSPGSRQNRASDAAPPC